MRPGVCFGKALAMVSALLLAGTEPEPRRRGEPPSGSLLGDPRGPLPQRLSRVGLFVGAPSEGVTISRAIQYEPVWPLWSSGSTKERHIVVPPNTRIDATGDSWEFPIGTVIFKTFSFERPIETRLLRRTSFGWDYAVYVWDEDGHDARLADIGMPTPVPVRGPEGDAFVYHVPAEIECRACHEGSDTVVLGVSELQLGPRLQTFVERGVLRAEVAAAPAAIEHADPRTKQVLGYLHGNCVHCHNGSGRPSSAFDLRADVALAALVGRSTQSSASVAGVRVVPGEPAHSVLYWAVSGGNGDPELQAMPPVGVDVVDADFVDLLGQWIVALD